METIKQNFLTSNEWQWRLLRTIVQGVVAFLVANVDEIASTFDFTPTQQLLIAGLVMAILSPVMSELGKAIENAKDTEVEIDG